MDSGPGTVTVIIPVFNVEKYVGHCVRSVADQTYSDLEILLIDDGSTDGSGSMCDALAKDDSRVRVIHQENRGLSMARNVGLDQASGEFVTFLDSDDWIHPRFVERLIDLMHYWDAEVACCSFERTLFEQMPDPLVSPQISSFDGDSALEALVTTSHTLLTISCAKIYKAQAWKDVRFPEGRLHEDEFTTYRLLHASNRVVVTNEAMYFYRQHGASITGAGFDTRRGLDGLDSYLERADFIKTHGRREVASLAYQQAFRKHVQMHAWLGEREPKMRRILLSRMHEILHQVDGERVPIAFRIFSSIYVLAPRAGAKLYKAQARLRRLPVNR